MELSLALDRHIVGQQDAKLAVILGLVSCEHVYIEGPPGVGKTHLAEVASKAAGLSRFSYQFHRDTRVDELIGDTTIMRESVPEGEIIRQGVRPGGMLTAHVCVLDDISRAPGEALNVLLRLLNERMYRNERLQLRCAIATGNPTREEFFNEPLDPAVLDRFALQVSVSGHVTGQDWDAAARIIRHHCATNDAEENGGSSVFTDGFWDTLDHDLHNVEFPEKLLRTLLSVLRALVSDRDVESSHLVLLTDRTFLVKVPRVMRAHALLEGRRQCIEGDLHVIRLFTRFRVPQSVHERIGDIIEEVIEQQTDTQERMGNGMGDGTGGPSGAPERGSNTRAPQTEQGGQSEPSASQTSGGAGASSANAVGGGMSHHMVMALSYVLAAWTQLLQYLEPPTTPSMKLDETAEGNMRVDGADVLLESLHGSLQRSSADLWPQQGGLPRGWRQMRHLRELADAEVASLSQWCSLPSPSFPRAMLRQRVERGGAIAVIRDVSDSMSRPDEQYLLARYASAATCGIVELARQSSMRIGYLEFADHASKHFTSDSDAHFFTRDYSGIKKLAKSLGTRGMTNYQEALRQVLEEFERLSQARGLNQRMHVVMLSDGEPTKGCRHLHEERNWAQSLRICIHTIFIGEGNYPAALARLAVDTNGKRFHAVPDYESQTIFIKDVSHQAIFEDWSWRSLFSGPRQVTWA